MNDIELTLQEVGNESGEPQVALVFARGGEEVRRCEVRVFSEDDIIAASNEMTGAGTIPQVDIDQAIAELIEPIRIKWLRSRDQQPERKSEEKPLEGPQVAVPRYVAVLPSAEDGGPREPGIRDFLNDRVLANFVLTLDEDIEVQDDVESWREFAGRLITPSGTSPFRIPAEDFADNSKLKAALFAAGGCELVIHANIDELRRAISTISKESGQVQRRRSTTNFGWTADKKAYLTPSVGISEVGIEVLDEKSELRVDLGSETPGCHLDMKKLEGDQLLRVKRHVVEDLLALNDRVVTHTLLGATAAAVLYPFARGAGRFALWLVGRTGAGKSFVAKLFSNFFGDFPVSSAPFTTWSATPNYVQRQGYYVKDALYLVDDYKPEVVPPYQVVRVLQTYADNTARGRLKSDATANVMRPIRGLLVCTGEDVPEHNASAIARSVIVRVPQEKKNVAAGTRCLKECELYSGVMADFILWLIAERRTEAFANRFVELQQRFNDDVAGQQNEIRIATNLAILGAAFEQFAGFLSDVWEGWQEACRKYVDGDLLAIRGDMLTEAKEQQASEVFLRALADLIQFGRVRIENMEQQNAQQSRVIGHLSGRRGPAVGGQDTERLEFCMSLALAEVNHHLREQGRPELRATERALLQQLREDGKLLSHRGAPLTDPNAEPTFRARIPNMGQRRVFAISRRALLGEG
jgi:hypothetical protein